MESWVKEVKSSAEEAHLANKDYPMVLMAGNHMEMVANTIMRDPAWNKGRRPCTMRTRPEDAKELGIADGEEALIKTKKDLPRLKRRLQIVLTEARLSSLMALVLYTEVKPMESMLTGLLRQNTETVWQPLLYIVIFPVGYARLSLQKSGLRTLTLASLSATVDRGRVRGPFAN